MNFLYVALLTDKKNDNPLLYAGLKGISTLKAPTYYTSLLVNETIPLKTCFQAPDEGTGVCSHSVPAVACQGAPVWLSQSFSS